MSGHPDAVLTGFLQASASACYLFAPLALGMLFLGLALKFRLASRLRRPLDGGRLVRGHRLFGANKTWLGLCCSLLGCLAGVAAQAAIGGSVGWLAVLDYSAAIIVPFALTLALGAAAGELVNSFAKRQAGLAPGQVGGGLPGALISALDQVDFLVVLWLLLPLWFRPDWKLVVASFGWILLLHPALTVAGRRLGIPRGAESPVRQRQVRDGLPVKE